jgi:hypothetical protein
MGVNTAKAPDALVIHDCAMTILADDMGIDLLEVETAAFCLDFYDCISIAWKFQQKFSPRFVNTDFLRGELNGSQNLQQVVERVRRHVDQLLG